MIAEKDPEVKEVVVTLKELSDDERNQMLAVSRMMKEWDEWGFRKEAYEKGLQEGEIRVLELMEQGYTLGQIREKLSSNQEQLQPGTEKTAGQDQPSYRG
jgi:hypothetical protein